MDYWLWRSTRALWKNVVGNIGFVVGDGRRIAFQDDIWIIRHAPLKELFPDLFRLTVLLNATLAITRGQKDGISILGDMGIGKNG